MPDHWAGRDRCEGSVLWSLIRVSGALVLAEARSPGEGGRVVGAKDTLPVGASSGLAAENGHQVNKLVLPEARRPPHTSPS